MNQLTLHECYYSIIIIPVGINFKMFPKSKVTVTSVEDDCKSDIVWRDFKLDVLFVISLLLVVCEKQALTSCWSSDLCHF